MEINIITEEIIPGGPQLYFLGGQFAVGYTRVPYFTVHMTISEAAQFLKTPQELPGWDDSNAELEALYQRQLDYRRVKGKILPYLTEKSERARFFNAITVALVPYAGRRFQHFEEKNFRPPTLERPNAKHILNVGPIAFGFFNEFDADRPHTYSIGQLRWNPDQTAAVAIDGQHRLAALKQLHQQDPAAENATRVCVILVVPSVKLGLRGQPQGESVLKLLRSMFIDLNKHARPVRRARLILLDDVDPQSVVVRRVIGERLRSVDPTNPMDDDRVPLGLIDWHRDDAKFDTGPYITSVLMIDKIVEILTATKVNAASPSHLARQVAAFQRFGFLPSEACSARLKAYKDSEEEWQDPFSYPQEDLDAIRESVGAQIAPIVAMTLAGLHPYREIVRARAEARALEPNFSSWFEAFSSQDGTSEAVARLMAVSERIRGEASAPKIDAWENLFAGNGSISVIKQEALFFKVVFQAAFFAAIAGLQSQAFPAFGCDDPASTVSKPMHLQRWAESLVVTVNHMLSIQPRFFDLKYAFPGNNSVVSFWAGSALSVTRDSVDFTSSAQDRIREILRYFALVGEGARAARRASLALGTEINGFLDIVAAHDEDYAKIVSNISEWVRFGNSANRGSMLRIVDAMTESVDESYKRRKATEQFDRRTEHAWSLLRRREA